MCGRVCCYLCIADWCKASAFPIKNSSGGYDYVEPAYIEGVHKYNQSYNVYPSAAVPVVTRASHFVKDFPNLQAENVIVPMHWGILPRSGTVGVYSCHNARLEKVLDSYLYRPEYLDNRRCVVLCNGYYEWVTTDKTKQPYFIYPEKIVSTEVENSGSDNCPKDCSEKPILKLAGLFSIKSSPEGKIYSVTVLTKEADAKLARMNSRMPIVLDSYDDVDSWLNFNKLNGEKGIKFLTNYSRREDKFCLKYYAVDKKFVNLATCQSEMCIERVELKLKRQATLDSWVSKRSRVPE